MTIELNLSTKLSAKYEINNLEDFLSIRKIVNSLEEWRYVKFNQYKQLINDTKELFDKLLSGEKIYYY